MLSLLLTALPVGVAAVGALPLLVAAALVYLEGAEGWRERNGG